MGDVATQGETNRDRVRRVLIDPLVAAGFRFRKGTDEAAAQKALNRIADALAYMGDRPLEVLAASLMTKGEGSARCFWPPFATVIGLAEAFQPRPLEQVPELMRWFASRAGQEALAGGRLVAEFMFFERKKRPPMTEQDRRIVAERAAQWVRRAERINERMGRGLMPVGDDGEWLHWFEGLERRLTSIVQGGIDARGTGNAG